MPPCYHLNILPLLLLVPAVAYAHHPVIGEPQASSTPARGDDGWRYDCRVTRVLKGGTISLSRMFDENGEASRDFVLWQPVGHKPGEVQRPLELQLSYGWSQTSQPRIELRKIDVQLQVGLDVDLPWVSWLQIQRPFPIEPHGVLGSTALSTEIFATNEHDMRNGHGELPLGDLLAYAEGYDMLDWILIRPSERLGGSKELMRGKVDIAALREAIDALPKLRPALAVKIKKPKVQCDRTWWGDQTIP